MNKAKNSRTTDLRYWAMILSGCTMGETAADFLSHGPMHLGYGLASVILVAFVFAALYAEFRAKVPNEGRYWTAIIIMSTAGTTLADFLSRTLELGYFWSTVMLVVLFVISLVIRRKGRPAHESLLPHVDITASSAGALPHIEISQSAKALPQTDVRYWTAIMVASTLGTTLGDMSQTEPNSALAEAHWFWVVC